MVFPSRPIGIGPEMMAKSLFSLEIAESTGESSLDARLQSPEFEYGLAMF
jgi:hypothetical protein